MATVDVKLGLSAAEFDLVRESVGEAYGFYLARGQQPVSESGLSASERREGSARAIKLKDLLDKFN